MPGRWASVDAARESGVSASPQAEPRVVGVERTTRPVGVHDGAAGRRLGVRRGEDVGIARPVGV